MKRESVGKELTKKPIYVLVDDLGDSRLPAERSTASEHSYEFDDLTDEMKHWSFLPKGIRQSLAKHHK